MIRARCRDYSCRCIYMYTSVCIFEFNWKTRRVTTRTRLASTILHLSDGKGSFFLFLIYIYIYKNRTVRNTRHYPSELGNVESSQTQIMSLKLDCHTFVCRQFAFAKYAVESAVPAFKKNETRQDASTLFSRTIATNHNNSTQTNTHTEIAYKTLLCYRNSRDKSTAI